jgi:hypothetical protein
MQMRPIVDRIQVEFEGQVAFQYHNAADGTAGQALFEALQLPGHPGALIYSANGDERYRGFGVVSENALRAALEAVLEDG